MDRKRLHQSLVDRMRHLPNSRDSLLELIEETSRTSHHAGFNSTISPFVTGPKPISLNPGEKARLLNKLGLKPPDPPLNASAKLSVHGQYRRSAVGGDAKQLEKRPMRFVHFAPQSRISSIRRSGLRGARIYCMPVTCDFWISHQWVGEMGRVHQEKMLAVYFVVPDQSPVEVGYFGHPTELTQAGATVEWISQLPSDPQPHPQLHPNNKLGVQVVLLGAVPRQNIYRIASINNLVGWRESPQGRSDCLCPVCLPAGSPNRIGQLRAAVRRLLRCWGQAESGAEMAGVLWELAEAVSAGRGKISLAQPSVRSKSSRHRQIGRVAGTRPELPQRLVQRALSHGDSRVRTALAGLVSHLSWPQAREVLQILLEDDCELVWQAAVMAVHRILGDQGALVHLSQAAGDPRFTAFLLSVLADD